MENRRHKTQRGQAIVLVTLALIAMCGILGLAVDLGWSYFVRREAQKSADAGALAAAERYLAVNGPAASYPAATSMGNTCPPSTTATALTHLENGCILMRGPSTGTSSWYGYIEGTNGGRAQHAILDETTDPAVMQAPRWGGFGMQVNAAYAVRARVWEQDIPQLFSAVLGNTRGTVSATATAAIVNVPWNFGLWGLGRGCAPPPNTPAGCSPDPIPYVPNSINNNNPQPSGMAAGTDMYLQGSAEVNMPNQAISLASQSANSPAAGDSTGRPTVIDDGTFYNSPTGTSVSGALTSAYPNQVPHSDFSGFVDPMAGKISPPVPQSALPNCPIPVGLNLNGKYLTQGIYYAVDASGNPVAQKIPFRGNVTFTSAMPPVNPITGATGPCYSSTPLPSGGFGKYVIFGGINGTSGDNFTFNSGEYVLAGAVRDSRTGNAQAVFSLVNNSGAVTTGSAGTAFILTDGNYPGLSDLLTISGNPLATNTTVRNQFDQGFTYIQGGSAEITLNGIDPRNSNAVANHLDNYGQLLFWQDRRNSLIHYHSEDGYPDTSPTTDGHVWTLPETPGANGDYLASVDVQNTAAQLDLNGVDPAKSSPTMVLQGAPAMTINGLIYQPRGALMDVQGGGSTSAVTGQLQIISGGYYLAGNATISSPEGPTAPLMHTIASLVQ
jgi:hypothetical protein